MQKEHAERIVKELSKAYETEMEGYGFYKTAAELIEDDKGRAVFDNLAKDELDHIKVISTIADSVKKGMGWMTYEEALKKKGTLEEKGAPIFPEKNELVERFKTNQTDMNAVEIGVEIEEDAVNFYSDLLAQAQSPEEKVALTELLEMEKNHLKLLRWEFESLNDQGFWCDHMEFSVEKETE